ncbi:MAG: bifunctional phosphoserine phosphatase/homoserine phosphotransferase ThrH [Pseudomonadota bacterium]
MHVLCLDLEGVLIPEIWQAVAVATGVDGLNKTTRDIPVYDDLMQYRLGLMAEHDISMSTIQAEIAKLEPLPGADTFLSWAREHFQIAIISDTFYEFARPMMPKLGSPLLLCHKLEVSNDRIVDYHIRQKDPKRASVRAFHSLQYTVYAAGDSFNDVTMLEEADHGFFYHAPTQIAAQFPQYPATESYAELREALLAVAEG